jgi:hypothetical protein
MSDPADAIGRGFAWLFVVRFFRILVYLLIGFLRPGWRRAIPFLTARDAYADKGTMNVPVYSDPRFDANIRAIEAELKRIRAGGSLRPFELPHDFPPGSRERVAALLGSTRGR